MVVSPITASFSRSDTARSPGRFPALIGQQMLATKKTLSSSTEFPETHTGCPGWVVRRHEAEHDGLAANPLDCSVP